VWHGHTEVSQVEHVWLDMFLDYTTPPRPRQRHHRRNKPIPVLHLLHSRPQYTELSMSRTRPCDVAKPDTYSGLVSVNYVAS
jgi:hypothetical protein